MVQRHKGLEVERQSRIARRPLQHQLVTEECTLAGVAARCPKNRRRRWAEGLLAGLPATIPSRVSTLPEVHTSRPLPWWATLPEAT